MLHTHRSDFAQRSALLSSARPGATRTLGNTESELGLARPVGDATPSSILLVALDHSNRQNHDIAPNDAATGTRSSQSDAALVYPVIDSVKYRLTDLASDPERFSKVLQQSFGDNFDKPAAEQIRQQTLDGDFSWMPNIEVVDGSALQDHSGQHGGATGLGAYSAETDTLYIRRDLLQSDPAQAASIITEELGHALDARLNTEDTAGDEGHIFAQLAGGAELDAEALAALRAENDSGTIMVDDKAVSVEFGIGSSLKKAAKKAVKSVKKAVSGAVDAVKGAVNGAVNTVKGLGSAVVDGVKSLGNAVRDGFRSLLENPFLAKIMAVAQYIPIPLVKGIATAYNLARSGYQVYQGVKHGSLSAVLGGIAGVASGSAKVGSWLGAPSSFVSAASRLGQTSALSGALYATVARGDFTAALGFASDAFSSTSAGALLGNAYQASQFRDAVRQGNWLAAIDMGLNGIERLTDADTPSAISTPLNTLAHHSQALEGILDTLRQGDVQAAAHAFVSHYGVALGISSRTGENIDQIASMLTTFDSVRNHLKTGDYTTALTQAASVLGMPISAEVQGNLGDALAIRSAVLDGNYLLASRTASHLADRTGHADISSRLGQLADFIATLGHRVGDVSASGSAGSIPAPELA